MALPRYDASAVHWRAILARFGMVLPPWLLLLGTLFVIVHTRLDQALERLLIEEGLYPRDPVGVIHVPREDLRSRCHELHGDLLWLFVVLAGSLAIAAWVVARYAAQRDASSRRAFHAERLAAIGEAMTALAHESRNAIQRGQASIEMLAKRVRDVPDAARHLTRLQAAQEDLHQLYERVRSYAAPMPLNRRPVDLQALVAETFADLEPGDDPRTIEFEVRVDADSPVARVDPFAMRAAFRNILENAVSPENDGETPRAVVRIDVTISDTRFHGAPALQVAIADNGPGIAPEVASRIFEPFFTTRSRGTGLGMAITRRVLEMHGGRIEIDARDPGETGARFTLTLPVETP